MNRIFAAALMLMVGLIFLAGPTPAPALAAKSQTIKTHKVKQTRSKAGRG